MLAVRGTEAFGARMLQQEGFSNAREGVKNINTVFELLFYSLQLA